MDYAVTLFLCMDPTLVHPTQSRLRITHLQNLKKFQEIGIPWVIHRGFLKYFFIIQNYDIWWYFTYSVFRAELAEVKKRAKNCYKERKKHDRFDGMPEEEVCKRVLPDHLAPDLDIIIVSDFYILHFTFFFLQNTLWARDIT